MSDIKQKENSLLVAYDKAAEILKGAEPELACRKTGATYEDRTYGITFLGKVHEIRMSDVSFLGEGIPTIVEVLILHYLTSMEDRPVKGDFVSFSSIPDGMFYFKSFKQRALDKLVSKFGKKPESLVAAAAALGGTRWTAGKYSSIIPVLPKVDLVVQIHEADDEFPAEANILFSDNVVNFLPVEDTAFLGGYLVGALVRAT